MLNLIRSGASASTTETPGDDWVLPADTIWIDLLNPTREEELAVERVLAVDLPTREEMAQIEPSSRLYQEAKATFLTATLLAHSQGDHPTSAPATFVLARGVLVTIRYVEFKAFAVFAVRAAENPDLTNGSEVMLELLDAIVERLAHVLESSSVAVQESSNAIFDRPRGGAFEPLLTGLARTQSVVAMVRTSLVSLGRLASFAGLAPEIAAAAAGRAHLTSLQHDIGSLTEHAGSLASQIAFLLDAALGLINIEQNGIIKFFSVVSVALMPPTLVASIYGMNFHHMPELSWTFGYPMALGVMLIAGLGPFLWFKKKRWL
ncbi:magnesium transporter CorA family protein [Phenylobacterium sp.]|uniref:magnesium transporter CorA family protein n=1 Tax=Phenylobacterium sp. TaxID=1871053 RepID=UPI0027236222|nr:magnesium transporter CorA family protein [Phenylobacterium sp.]MDO8798926.1 magnesium transporter CorA family protein [Phenylobacterium sp.]